MKYKVYLVKEGHEINEPSIFIEVYLNNHYEYDSIDDAINSIRIYGDRHVSYTILPHICVR